MYCTNCGNKSNEGEKYCTNCGEPLDKEEIIVNQPNNSNENKNNTPLILGVLSCVFFFIPLISIPLAILSIVTGISQKKETNKVSIGMILGIISIVLTTTMIIIIVLITRYALNHVDDFIDDFQMDEIIEKYKDEYENSKEGIAFDIKGYSWLADDNSILYLNSDNSYTWYQRDNNHEDNYYSGKFTVYNGEEAIKYIAKELEEFGLTESEQESFFKKGITELNDYYLLILTCEKSKMNGKEENGTNNVAYYYGFYSKKRKYFELTNLSTKKKAGFTIKEKINNIDV